MDRSSVKSNQWLATLLLLVVTLGQLCFPGAAQVSAENLERRPRLREMGVSIGVLPTGPTNSITDVAGVQVGHHSVVRGKSIRTGVTAIIPHKGNVFLEKTPAAFHVANGFGKFVGGTQVQELGVMESPIVLTNTLSTFSAADALIGWSLAQPGCEAVRSVNPIVGECNDGFLNDIQQRVIGRQEVLAALKAARTGPVDEGCVGAGFGTRCMGWKGGIGSASRRLPEKLGGYTIGVLVQTNFGGSLTIAGAPVGRELGRYYLQDEVQPHEHGSCIVIIATDAPLDSRRLLRLARRAPLGLASVGSSISHGSGDYVLAFSTAKGLRTPYQSKRAKEPVELLRDDRLSPLFQAVKDATEEAVVNSMLRAVTIEGQLGRTVDALDPQAVIDVCRKYGVLKPVHKVNSQAGSIRRSAPRFYASATDLATDATIKGLNSQLPALMKKHRVPGLALTLIRNRQLVYARGFGVRCVGAGSAVEADTVMEACSMSKPFFAYRLLQLVEQNRFDLDRPLVEYLDADYFGGDDRHRKITARMVLSHTTGLPNWRKGGWRAGGPLTLAFEPGAKFRYSGEGFLMLQRAVEKATSQNLDGLAREGLIQPLELHNTRFVWDERLLARASCGHDKEGKLISKRRYYDEANSAYTLYTSAEDYAKFLVEIMKSDRSAAHSISAKMREEMLTATSHRTDQDADWGLGWGLREDKDGRQVVFHSGSNGSGFRCYAEFRPAGGDGLVIMTNAVGGAALWKEVINREVER